ncbi:hypothetical protein [Marinobacter vulgaris]|uniref:hypothetical protein n=1 Tax=Marinobacter vulgaris TaxID=1928331 RepID=UPI001D0DA05D|nr:hypothetical protein [Marinobacter vulgaris]
MVNSEQKARIDQVIGWIGEVFQTSRDHALPDFHEWIARSGLPGLASTGVTEEQIISASQAAASCGLHGLKSSGALDRIN